MDETFKSRLKGREKDIKIYHKQMMLGALNRHGLIPTPINYYEYTTFKLENAVSEAPKQIQKIIDGFMIPTLSLKNNQTNNFKEALCSQAVGIPKEHFERVFGYYQNSMESLKNTDSFRELNNRGKRLTISIAETVKSRGILLRGTNLEEFSNIVAGNCVIGTGNKIAKFGQDMVHTTTSEQMARSFATNNTQNHKLGIVLEYDVAGLKKDHDWKPLRYVPGPDLLKLLGPRKFKRVGETWSDAYQSISFARGMEVYVNPKSKVEISRVKIPAYELPATKVEQATKTIKSAGYADRLEILKSPQQPTYKEAAPNNTMSKIDTVKGVELDWLYSKTALDSPVYELGSDAGAAKNARRDAAKSGEDARSLEYWYHLWQ